MNDDLKKIVELRHDRPLDILGPRRIEKDRDVFVIHAFIPHALAVTAFVKRPLKKIVEMDKIHPNGLFSARMIMPDDSETMDYVLRVVDTSNHRSVLRDPYGFPIADLAADEEIQFSSGRHCHLHERCGAHLQTRHSVSGVHFGVWAPNARRVSVVGSFNRWDGRYHPMQRVSRLGLWELFVPGVAEGDFYKFEIATPNGDVFLKSDPYAYQVEDSAEAAAIVCDLPRPTPKKSGERRAGPLDTAVFCHEPPDDQSASLEPPVSELFLRRLVSEGYSHLALPAWVAVSAKTIACFSPNSHFGNPRQAMDLIERCHRLGIGVIVDVIPPKLAETTNSLAFFDGTPLYEEPNKQTKGGFQFAVNRPAVKNFFLSYLIFWRERYRVDGFRIKPDWFNFYQETIKADGEGSGAIWLIDEADPPLTLPKDMLKHLFENRSLDNPHAILGPHRQPAKKIASIRAILPRARQAWVYFTDQPHVRHQMRRPDGERVPFWQAVVPFLSAGRPYRLHVLDRDGSHRDVIDTYAIDVSYINDRDRRLFAEGNHYQIYRVLGAHRHSYRDIEGVNFALWAPNAAAVNVIGNFNGWEGSGHPMRFHRPSGIWELFVPDIGSGEHYQFEIFPRQGEATVKADPYAFNARTAPATESVVYELDDIYQWHDDEWLRQRRRCNIWRSPVAIYEVHLGSWRRGPGNRLLNYTEIAERLIPYVKEMGFTHIEILPIAEHPYEPSWGYQVSNFYAPTSRLGKPEQLMAFIDLCHQNGIGVLLDWVAGHFPKDAHALAKFDGTHLYEHEDPRKGEHKDWGTLIFNYGRHEVGNFLIANALFWLEHYHFDGLRVDAVASMLYLDYSRKDGEWIPNVYGGNENLEAIEFLKHANYIVHGRYPGVMMIAEESTAWAGVTRPTDSGGLGFGFKWNMGWMHDILAYLETPPEFRKYHHNRLGFIFHYAFEENFVLSLSHDEVVHLKGSLYTKMPGSEWEKLANLRLLFFFMYSHPGKKLVFMGGEFGQRREWHESGELQWELLDNDMNRRLQTYVKAMNRLYRDDPVLHEMDCRPSGFAWIDSGNHEQSIIVFCRKAKDPRIALVVVINFSAISRFDYRIGVPYPVPHTEIFNSNDLRYGGCGETAGHKTYALEDAPWHGQEFSIRIDRLPALTALLLKPAAPE